MKQSLFFLFLFLSIQIYPQQNENYFTDSKNYSLKGNVQSINEINYKAKRRGDAIIINKNKTSSKFDFYFNKWGNISSYTCDCVYSTFLSGIEATFEFKNNVLYYYTMHNIDKTKLLSDYNVSWKNNDKTCIINGKENNDKNEVYYDSIEYDNQYRDLYKYHTYQKDNHLKYSNSIVCKYNESGDLIEEKRTSLYFKDDKSIKSQEIEHYLYKYIVFDEQKNWTERECINIENGKTEHYTIRKIEYY